MEKKFFDHNSRWRTAAILQIAKSAYLKEKLSDFHTIWYTNADLELDDSRMTKYENLKKSRRQTTATLQIVFGNSSAADRSISVTFCTGKQNSMAIEVVP